MFRCASLLLILVAANAFQVAPSSRLVSRPTLSPSPLFRKQPTLLRMADAKADDKPFASSDELIVSTSQGLGRVSWFSWWSQVILTVVSSVTLLFARNVLLSSTGSFGTVGAPGFVFAGTGTTITCCYCIGSIRESFPNLFLFVALGIVTSALSIIWTWGSARLSRRLKRKATSRVNAANMLRRSIRVGVTLNLIGMLVTLLGAEQIIGGLAIKVLTMQGALVATSGTMPSTLQPLDILIVQANTNTLLSHFCSLVGFLWLTNDVDKLDPPSVEGDKRK
jgi:hypothetical protein